MMTIDAHQHFWCLDRRSHNWPEPARAALNRDFTLEDLLPEMDRAGVDGTVLMQSLNDADETVEFLNLASGTDRVRGVVGWVPLYDPDRTIPVLDRLPRSGKLVGIRHLINFEPDPRWLLSSEVQASIDAIAERGLVFDTVPNDPIRFEAVLATAERRPGLQVVIDHLGRPPVAEAGWEPWATLVSRAAELPNVSMKLSVGLDVVLGWTWSTEALRRYTDHVLEMFGAERVMAASNWPVSTLAAGYGEIWSGIRDLVSSLSAQEREMVLGGTAAAVFGLSSNSARKSAPAEMGDC